MEAEYKFYGGWVSGQGDKTLINELNGMPTEDGRLKFFINGGRLRKNTYD